MDRPARFCFSCWKTEHEETFLAVLAVKRDKHSILWLVPFSYFTGNEICASRLRRVT